MRGKDLLLSGMMGVSTMLYSLATVNNSWFIWQPHSFYGLWSVIFCDFFKCQIIPALFSDEPGWYHCIQVLSLVALIGVVAALLLMVLPVSIANRLPRCISQHRQTIISVICFTSALSIVVTLATFYSQLVNESGEGPPQVSWCSVLAALSAALDFVVGVLLLPRMSALFPSSQKRLPFLIV